jgi:hypothetical protein
VDTKTAEKEILQQVDLSGGSIMARDKLIPLLSRKIKKGEKCHDIWDDLERGLYSLEDKQVVQLTHAGRIIRGITRIDNDEDTLVETPDTTPDTNNQEGIAMTTEDESVGELAETKAVEEPVRTYVGNFKDLPHHEQLNRAWGVLKHYSGPDGMFFDASSVEVLMVGLEIPKSLAGQLNRDLGVLGRRKTVARLKKQIIDLVLPDITEEEVASLLASSSKSETVVESTGDGAPSTELVQAVSEPTPKAKAKTPAAKTVTPITSIAQLEARFAAVVAKIEGEKEALKTEKDAAVTRASDLERELKKVRKETQKLVDKVCGERDEAQRQLQLLRQAASQPLQISTATENLLARYEE